MQQSQDEQFLVLLLLVGAGCLAVLYRRKWHGSGTAYGTAKWVTETALRAAGMLSAAG